MTRHKVNRFIEDLEKLFLSSFCHDCLLYLQQKHDCFLHKERQFQKTWLNKRVTEIAGMYFLQFSKSFCILWDQSNCYKIEFLPNLTIFSITMFYILASTKNNIFIVYFLASLKLCRFLLEIFWKFSSEYTLSVNWHDSGFFLMMKRFLSVINWHKFKPESWQLNLPLFLFKVR